MTGKASSHSASQITRSGSLIDRIRQRQFRLALFDLDGTLVDSVPDLAIAVDASLQENGYAPCGEKQVRNWVGNGAAMLVKRALAHTLSLPDTDSVPDSVFEQTHSAFFRYYQQHYADHSKLYAGVTELLAGWKADGIPMVLITNKPARFTPQVCQSLGIDSYFSLMLSGDSLPEKKPHPAPLLHACKALEVSPGDTIMIGDSVHDLDAARAAGISAVAVSYGYNHGANICDAGPDLLVDSLAELL